MNSVLMCHFIMRTEIVITAWRKKDKLESKTNNELDTEGDPKDDKER